MAEVDDIVQNIVLTGNEDVNRAFDSMREAGEKAFESINKAAEHSLLTFSGMATAITGVVAAVGVMTVGMFAFVKSTEEGVSALSDLASQTGSTIEEMSSLSSAFKQAGADSDQMHLAFRRLSNVIQQSWTEIKHASAEGADKLRSDSLSVAKANDTLIDAQQKQTTLSRDQALQRISNIQGVAGAQLRVDELRSKFLQARGYDTSQLDAVNARERESLEMAQAELALAEARKKARDDEIKASHEAERTAREIEQAQIARNNAQRQAEENRRNDITNITDAVRKTAEGDKGALKDVNASAENIAKGIINSSEGAGKALGQLKGDITDLAQPAPALKNVLDQIGKVLANIEDPALRNATAFRLLGRVSQDFINLISDPSKLEEFRKRIDDLGLSVNKTDQIISEKFRESLFRLTTDVGLIGTKIATALGPSFTSILTAIDEALIKNKQSIIDFANAVGSQAIPVIESFIRVLSGAPDLAKDQWLVDYLDKVKALGAGFGDLFTAAKTVFNAIYDAAKSVADGLNSVFGTNLNAIDVLFAAWVARIVTGMVAVQAAAMTAATGIETSFAAAFAAIAIRFAVISGVIIAVTGVINLLNDVFGKTTSHWDVILEGTMKRLEAIGEILSGDIKKGFADFAKATEEQAAKEKALDEQDKQSADAKKTTEQQKVDTVKDSVDKQIKELERLTDATKQHAQEQSKATEAAAKSPTTTTTPTTPTTPTGQPVFDPKTGVTTIPFGSGGGSGGRASADPMTSLVQAAEKAFGTPVTGVMVDAYVKAMAGNSTATAANTKAIENNSKVVEHPPAAADSLKGQLNEITKQAVEQMKTAGPSGPIGGLQMDPKDVQDAIDAFRASKREMGAQPEPTRSILEALGDRTDGSLPGQRPTTEKQLDRMLENQRQNGERDGKQMEEFSRTIGKQLGQPDDFIEQERAKQHGIVPSSTGGTADLSERLYPGGPLRYRRQNDPTYQPPELGHYDPVTQAFIPNAPKDQPFPRVKESTRNMFKGRDPLDNVFDTSGRGISNPIYNYGQPQSTTFPNYRDSLRKELQASDAATVPLPRPRPEEAKQLSDAVEKGVTDAVKDTTTAAPSVFQKDVTPAGFPALPPQEPITPELTPFKDVSEKGAALASTFDKLIEQGTAFGQSLPTTTAQDLNQAQQRVSDTFNQVVDSVSNFGQNLKTAADQTTGDVPVQGLDDSLKSLDTSTDQSASSLDTLDQAASQAASALSAMAQSNIKSGAAGMAGGGHIRGFGSSTSDSIPIWASDGEFMHSARAVSFWGTDFMHAINNLRMPKFSAGGLIGLFSPAMPRFAGGGPISADGVTMAHLGTVDLRTDHGNVTMMASPSAVSQLSKLAVQKRITSTGRKPGFIG